jgi:hypothetical protein
MRSTQDPIKGLQKYIEEWGVASEEQMKEIDKKAKQEVDAAVEEAKKGTEPELKDLWTDIYYAGTEPEFMRGREREEVCHDRTLSSSANDFCLGSLLQVVTGRIVVIYSLVSLAIIECFYGNECRQSEEER